MPEIFEDVKMKDIQTVAPDEGDHCKVLHSMTGGEVRRAFGMPASMVSCWACLCGWMVKGHVSRVLTLDDVSIMAALHECLAELRIARPGDYAFRPGPKAFGHALFTQ